MAAGEEKLSGREAQRRETRQRVYAAAIAEFKRTGMAAADVGTIAKEAGVARGTFYFHFPTKEHVLAELERLEEARLADQLSKFLAAPHDLAGALAEVVRLMTVVERRVGKVLFREMLGLHFSPRRPEVLPGADQWAEYPVMTLVIQAIELARDRGEVYPGADALPTAQFFLLGLYAMLITSHEQRKAARTELLDNFLATVLRGVESRLLAGHPPGGGCGALSVAHQTSVNRSTGNSCSGKNVCDLPHMYVRICTRHSSNRILASARRSGGHISTQGSRQSRAVRSRSVCLSSLSAASSPASAIGRLRAYQRSAHSTHPRRSVWSPVFKTSASRRAPSMASARSFSVAAVSNANFESKCRYRVARLTPAATMISSIVAFA